MRASRSGVQILENGGVLLLYLRSEEARSGRHRRRRERRLSLFAPNGHSRGAVQIVEMTDSVEKPSAGGVAKSVFLAR